MNGEIDLELYTLSIIKLNNAIAQIDNINEDIINLFKECADDFEKLYEDILDDLNQEYVNFGEYWPFFQNGKQTFPQYIEILTSIDNPKINEYKNQLIQTFNNLNKIAEAFKERDYEL